MATHDYVLANASGAAFRTDLNNALAAIVSNNSNSSEPATMYAYQWWADTNTGTLKIRNSANNGWVELLQLDGTLTMEDGSASTPGLAFRDDLNTGIFSAGADTFNVATGGVERMELGATTIFNEDGADVDFRIEGNAQANLLFIDAGDKRVGISSGSPIASLHVVDSGTSGDGTIAIGGTNTNASATLFYEISGNTYLRIKNLYRATSSSAYIEYDAGNHRWSAGTSGSEAMRLDSSGRLLLATTTEGHDQADNLTIADSANCGLTIRSGTSSAGAVFFSDSTSGTGEYDGFITYNQSSRKMSLGTATSTKVSIMSSGEVGLGTSSPDSKLHLSYDSGESQIRLTRSNSASNTNDYGRLLWESTSDVLTGKIAVARESGEDNGYMHFSTASGGSLTERVRIDSNGNFFVGRTGTINADGKTVSSVFEQLFNNAFAMGIHANQTNKYGMAIYYTAGGTANNFLICNIAGSNKFELKGNGGLANVQSNDVNLSDIAVKKNITDATSTINEVKQWEIKEFHYTEDDDISNKRYGVIAQQVETIDPRIVTNYDSKLKGVKEQQMYWKAIKALQEEILKREELEARIAALETN